MTWQLSFTGHIEDESQIDAGTQTVRQAAAQFVDTVQAAGITISHAEGALQRAGQDAEYVNLLETAAPADPSEQGDGASGDTGTPPTTA